jgi:uncharacterized protein RhaS with RHS repeats
LNLHAYAGNPVQRIDPLGLEGCYVHFPDYPIEIRNGIKTTLLGGHAGVLSYDTEGNTRYCEYGRYNPEGENVIGNALETHKGNVRCLKDVPSINMDKNGKPTQESMEKLQEYLYTNAGAKTKVKMTCSTTANANKINEYINEIADNPNREEYNWKPWSENHCRTFAQKSALQGSALPDAISTSVRIENGKTDWAFEPDE